VHRQPTAARMRKTLLRGRATGRAWTGYAGRMLGLDQRALKVAWTWFLFALAAAALYEVRAIIARFVMALFVALLLSPLVKLAARFTPARFGRGLTLAIVYVLLLGTFAAVVIPVLSAASREAAVLAEKLPEAIRERPLQRIPLPPWLEPARDRILSIVYTRLDTLAEDAFPLVTRALGQLATGVGVILSAVLVPILAFFFLKDGEEMCRSAVVAFPEARRALVETLILDLGGIMSQYIRALVILSAVTFVCYLGFLAITGAPYPALLSGAAAMLEFIPGVGPFVAAVLILTVALLSGYSKWILLLVFFGIYRVLQDYVLQPALMKAGVQLHPLMVIFAALAGAQIAGILGVFFSVPFVAGLRAILLRLREAGRLPAPGMNLSPAGAAGDNQNLS
jgi:predicted PurR-regulated permease PerM